MVASGNHGTEDASIPMKQIQKIGNVFGTEKEIKLNGQIGEGGVFSNSAEEFGEKSQFNKDKWLPLVYIPVKISHYCCFKIKKQPLHQYQSEHKYKPIIATLTEESRVRKQGWIRHGCNAFDSKTPTSQPMSFWTEQDVLAYIVLYNLPLASVYGDVVGVDNDGNCYEPLDLSGKPMCSLKCTGFQRTGCAFCAFGLHLEKNKKTRFQLLAEIEPKKYAYAIGGGSGLIIRNMMQPHRSMTVIGLIGIQKKYGFRQKRGLGWERSLIW